MTIKVSKGNITAEMTPIELLTLHNMTQKTLIGDCATPNCRGCAVAREVKATIHDSSLYSMELNGDELDDFFKQNSDLTPPNL